MARKKAKQKAKKRKRTIPPGDCIVISTPGGKRKLCKDLDGDVRFVRMSFKPKKRRTA